MSCTDHDVHFTLSQLQGRGGATGPAWADYQNFRRHATNQDGTRRRPRAWKSERDFAVNGSREIMRGLARNFQRAMNSLPLPPQNALIGRAQFFGGKRLPGERSGAAAKTLRRDRAPLRHGKHRTWAPLPCSAKVWRREEKFVLAAVIQCCHGAWPRAKESDCGWWSVSRSVCMSLSPRCSSVWSV